MGNRNWDSSLKIRQPVAELVIVPGNDLEREAVELFAEHFEEEINVKKVRIRADREGLCSVAVAPNNKLLGPKFGRNLQAAKAAIATIDGVELDQRLARGESFSLAVTGADVPIELSDLMITRSYGEGCAGAADGATVVLIDTRITPELRNEGLARDIVRNVQNLRKDAGLDIADRIRLSLVTDSSLLRAAIDQSHDYIASETLAVEICGNALASPLANTSVEIDGKEHSVAIELEKAR